MFCHFVQTVRICIWPRLLHPHLARSQNHRILLISGRLRRAHPVRHRVRDPQPVSRQEDVFGRHKQFGAPLPPPGGKATSLAIDDTDGGHAAGISLLLSSARRSAARDGAKQAGIPSNGRSFRQAFVHATRDCWDQMGMRRGPRGDGAATCKIAGIAYTGSNPVPATSALSCEKAAPG
jgi:hypothetical protein